VYSFQRETAAEENFKNRAKVSCLYTLEVTDDSVVSGRKLFSRDLQLQPQ